MEGILRPEMVPIWGTVFGTLMVFGIVAVVFWYKAREKELQAHQEMRIREMEHQRRMKELELEIEKTKASQDQSKVDVPGPTMGVLGSISRSKRQVRRQVSKNCALLRGQNSVFSTQQAEDG